MRTFLPQFDHVVLLSAPTTVIVERLGARTNNPYGKHPDEVARVLRLVENVEPLLRRVAGHEIDTSARLDDVVATLLQVIRPSSGSLSFANAFGPPMEQRRGADTFALPLEVSTAGELDVFQLLDGGEMPIDQARIGERP
jgi:hypothetical protein